MSLKRLVDVATVSQLLKKNIINKEGVRILDCSYETTQIKKKPDWRHFKKEFYGNFEKILAQPCPSKQLYLSGHIPLAPHVSIDAAFYPSQYERYALYPPEVFQRFMRVLGIDSGEHLILYSNSRFGGMIYAMKMAWLIQSYGHDKLSVIDGGFEEWKRKGYEISKEDVKLKPGNWCASDNINKYNITFEQLESDHGDKKYIEWTDYLNLLDARIRGQFGGTAPTGLQKDVTGTHISGFKNLPAAELINDGLLKSPDELQCWLLDNGFSPDKPTVVLCNAGVQASMLAYAIKTVYPNNPIQVYNGSLGEMQIRNPKRISAKADEI